jgi:hypothetical protein
MIDITLAIRECGEDGVIALGVEWHRPVNLK